MDQLLECFDLSTSRLYSEDDLERVLRDSTRFARDDSPGSERIPQESPSRSLGSRERDPMFMCEWIPSSGFETGEGPALHAELSTQITALDDTQIELRTPPEANRMTLESTATHLPGHKKKRYLCIPLVQFNCRTRINRVPPKGNNSYGRTGALRCKQCRKRRWKVQGWL